MKTKNSQFIYQFYHEKDIAKIDQKIAMLGQDTKLTTEKFMNFRLLSSLIIFVILFFTLKLNYLLAPLISVLYYYLTQVLLLDIPISKRAKRLDREALTFFEILTLTLESGRNLENSLEVTCANVDSEISREFQKSLLEIKFGKSLTEALEDMKKRIPSETINNIILNITQTNIFGNTILDTMYNQIAFLRDKQLLEIKGEINKIPNKISIISVIFIVPLILLMILGPILINFLG